MFDSTASVNMRKTSSATKNWSEYGVHTRPEASPCHVGRLPAVIHYSVTSVRADYTDATYRTDEKVDRANECMENEGAYPSFFP